MFRDKSVSDDGRHKLAFSPPCGSIKPGLAVSLEASGFPLFVPRVLFIITQNIAYWKDSFDAKIPRTCGPWMGRDGVDNLKVWGPKVKNEVQNSMHPTGDKIGGWIRL